MDKKQSNKESKVACLIYERLVKRIVSTKVRRNLKRLYQWEDDDKALKRYYVDKISLLLKIAVIFTCILVIMCITSINKKSVVDGVVKKNEYGEGGKLLRVEAATKDGYKIIRELDIKERRFSEMELEEKLVKLFPILEKIVQGENDDLLHIKRDLTLPSSIEGYPFALTWFSKSDYINGDGEISRDLGEEGTSLQLYVDISYFEFRREFIWNLYIYPVELEERDRWELDLDKALQEEQEKALREKELKLPSEINGKKVIWKEKVNSEIGQVAGLMILTLLLIYFMKDQDLGKQVAQRNEKLMEAYSTVIHKLCLYLGAGMTVSGAWKKIAYDQKDKEKGSNHIYEEMLYTCYEINSGVPESVAYERFGKRIRIHSYTKLAGLLTQNLKMGNSALLLLLREEATEALEEKRHMVKRKADEMGTKMLAPMMLMLGIVMALIMIPAFSSLGI